LHWHGIDRHYLTQPIISSNTVRESCAPWGGDQAPRTHAVHNHCINAAGNMIQLHRLDEVRDNRKSGLAESQHRRLNAPSEFRRYKPSGVLPTSLCEASGHGSQQQLRKEATPKREYSMELKIFHAPSDPGEPLAYTER